METTNVTADSMADELAESILPVTILVVVLAIFGLLGNGVVLFVYKFKYRPCNFRIFVLFLALIDFASCLVVLPTEVYVQRRWFNFPRGAVWLCVVKKIVSVMAICMTACVLFLISVDRFRKVCRPLSWQIKPARAIQLCTAILVIFFLSSLPGVAIFGQQTSNVTYQGQCLTISTCQRADGLKNEVWTSVYVHVFFVLPTIVFTLAHSLLYVLVAKKLFCSPLATLMGISSSNGNTVADNAPSLASSTDVLSASPRETSLQRETETVFTTGSFVSSPCTEISKSDDALEKVCGGYQASRRERIKRRSRIKRKTAMMLIVTIVFDVTSVIYFSVYSIILQKAHIFELVSEKSAGALFFFWRLYFFNHVINPVVYGFCDSGFRKCLKDLVRKIPCNRRTG